MLTAWWSVSLPGWFPVVTLPASPSETSRLNKCCEITHNLLCHTTFITYPPGWNVEQIHLPLHRITCTWQVAGGQPSTLICIFYKYLLTLLKVACTCTLVFHVHAHPHNTITTAAHHIKQVQHTVRKEHLQWSINSLRFGERGIYWLAE